MDFKFKVVNKYCYSVTDLLECCTVELLIEKGKNIIISCVYRTPGSQITSFIDKIESMLSDLRITEKLYYMCGDFNIDLLKCDSHKDTSNFKEILLCHGIYPFICKPTRISQHSATLIDNIFTNNLKNITSGIFITDISDHLPVFMCNSDVNFNKSMRKGTVFIGNTNESNMSLFENKLKVVCWDMLYSQSDINSAYDMFIKKFTTLSQNCCPLIKVDTKHKFVKPWFTSGLSSACKRKMCCTDTF